MTNPFPDTETSEFLVEALKHFESSIAWFSPKMYVVGGCTTPTARELLVSAKLRDASQVRCPTCETAFYANHTVHDYISYEAQCTCTQSQDTMALAFNASTKRIIESAKELGLLPKSVQAVSSGLTQR